MITYMKSLSHYNNNGEQFDEHHGMPIDVKVYIMYNAMMVITTAVIIIILRAPAGKAVLSDPLPAACGLGGNAGLVS